MPLPSCGLRPSRQSAATWLRRGHPLSYDLVGQKQQDEAAALIYWIRKFYVATIYKNSTSWKNGGA